MADWSKIKSRGSVSDRRGMKPMALGGIGSLGGVGILMVIAFSLLGGGDSSQFGTILEQLQQQQIQSSQVQQADTSEFAGEDSYETFVSTVLGSNNDLWQQVFANSGQTYTSPELVLFRQATNSACGGAYSAIGPHYCPGDNKIYIDETFFDELQARFGAQGGDVAEAYVIAHEVGHHVQNLLGTSDNVRQASARDSDKANELSVNLELQADCYAGVWANSISDLGVLGPNEIKEAMDAAEAVGDDRIQQATEGSVNPEAWTHGSSEQRLKWFNEGYQNGDPAKCNTFEA